MSLRKHLLWLACAVALVGAVLPSQGEAQTSTTPRKVSAADAAAAVAWLKQAGHRLTTEAPGLAELKPLLERLNGARVVGIGEATHGTHEDVAFKASLIKALVAAGRINAVAWITSRSAGKRLDAYVAGGPGTAADALRDSGLAAHWVTVDVVDLLDWLRTWNLAGKERIHLVGVDVQDVLHDTQSALTLLASVEPEAAAMLQDIWKSELTPDQLRRPFSEVVRGWTRQQWETLFVAARVLEDLLVTRPTTRLAQAPGYSDARHAARAARLGLFAFEFDIDGTSGAPLPAEAYSRRDVAAGEQLLAVVGPPARAALWGHDAQVARAAFGADAAFTTGEYLGDRLGKAYRTVGFAWRRGSVRAVSGAAEGSAPASRTLDVTLSSDSLGSLVAKAGLRSAWFDLTAVPDAAWSKRWLAQPYDRGWFGGIAGAEKAPPTPLGKAFDVLVFFDTVAPSQPARAAP